MSIPDARKEVMNPITGKKVSTTIIDASNIFLLTEFWDYARTGDPIVCTYLKDGVPLYDTGVFKALQGLLRRGKIYATREATEKQLEEVRERVERAKVITLLIVTSDCYVAITASALALLTFMGQEPVPPSKLPGEVKTTLVDTEMLDEKYLKWLEEIIELRKKAERREISFLDGKTVDLWLNRAEEFVSEMFRLLGKLETKKAELIILRTAQTFYSALISSLLEVSPESVPSDVSMEEIDTPQTFLLLMDSLKRSKEKLMSAFVRFFVKPGLIDPAYLNVWDEVDRVLDLLRNGKVEEITLSKAETLREAVRLFVRDLKRVMKNF